MKKTFGYVVLMVLTWPMQFFPLGFHYVFSNILFFLFYRVVGYRRKVVAENIRKSLPEKSAIERAAIVKKFYHHFADMFIEALYFTHTSYRKTSKLLEVENLELVHQLLAKGKNVILVSGHVGNWEYFQLFREKLDGLKYYVYKRMGNKTFDDFYKRIRSRGAEPLEMGETYRRLYSTVKSGEKYIAFFISDQRPLANELFYWLTFMNQDTPVMTGTEKIARNTNAAVVYTEIIRVKRGYARLRFELLKEDIGIPKGYEITDRFMARLEESIRQYPDQYFWTHKRWKYKKPIANSQQL
jgi:KDO2-lipid IV(A) lauroyltransferase